jgi:type II secretory pathway component PulF
MNTVLFIIVAILAGICFLIMLYDNAKTTLIELVAKLPPVGGV